VVSTGGAGTSVVTAGRERPGQFADCPQRSLRSGCGCSQRSRSLASGLPQGKSDEIHGYTAPSSATARPAQFVAIEIDFIE